ncbi:transporter permease [Listeria floridensis FSL S10-1187]|uniref:Transporter permease n=1 Tax=Listeria floridensis FSL S10-1187 TaxID=1265817 RepID=A0ABP3AY85_9LIST|nr:iron ABC transporter permease [Listeria floridensis]EUJ32012.1 transporter permease [Listeria floridensis FSL S10-1187]
MTFKISMPLRFVLGFLVLGLSCYAALACGAVNYSFSFLWEGFTKGLHQTEMASLYELRIPRIFAAAIIGAALGVSGTIMQAVTRNPLADPGLLGVSAGAKLMLSIIIAFLPGLAFPFKMGAAFIGAALGTMLVLFISRSSSIYKIVLAGAAISAFLLALSNAISLLSKTSKELTMWTSGGLAGVTGYEVKLLVPVLVAGLVISFFFAKQIGILTMSDDVATGLGVSTQKVRFLLFILVAVLTGASVSVIGEIAFVGLIVPHFARFVSGSSYRVLLPMSALVGAIFLIISDMLSRVLAAPFEIPVIAILSVVGLPFFIFIVRRGLKA